jgi:phage tail-like protein
MKIVDSDGHEIIRPVPGRLTYHSIDLTRNVSEDMNLSQWRGMVEDGEMTSARRTMVLSYCDAEGATLAQWQLVNTWPTMVMVNPYPVEGTFEATTTGGAVEVLTLTCEDIQRLQ